MKTLGILGGMGPHASIRFYQLIIELSQRVHYARANADFPHLLLSNLPVQDLISSRDHEEQTVAMLANEAKRLEGAGAEVLVLACNTMHLFTDRFLKDVRSSFLSMIDAVVEQVVHDGRRTVGLLGSLTTMQSHLYTRPLEEKGIHVLLPPLDEQTRIASVIKAIIASHAGAREIEDLSTIMEELRSRGAEGIILGCTELPLLVDAAHCRIPIYNSLQILAQAACRAIYS